MKELIIPPLRLKQIETSQEPLLVEDEQFVKTFLKAFNLDENDERSNDDPVKTKNQSITRQRRKQTNRQTNRQSNRQTNRSIRRKIPVLTPQTQHFCANVDMPFNPFLQYEHQAYLRAERKRLKQEKSEWEEYEYQMKKQEVEEYKYRIYEEPKIEREAERRRQEQELKKLQAMQKKADEGFKFKKKKRKRKGKRGSDTQQTPQTTEYGNGALAATV